MSKAKGEWIDFGSVNESKKGGFYLKVTKDVVLKAGDNVLLRKPQDQIQSLVEKGILDEDAANERLNKIPSYVKYNATLPPRDTKGDGF